MAIMGFTLGVVCYASIVKKGRVMNKSRVWVIPALIFIELACASWASAQTAASLKVPPSSVTTPAPAPAEPGIFHDAPVSHAKAGVNPEPFVIRERRVLLDAMTIREKTALRLNLFPDLVLNAVLSRVEEHANGRFSWFGTVQNIAMSSVVLTVSASGAVGVITAPGVGTFQLIPLGGTLHTVRQINEEKMGGCAVGTGESGLLKGSSCSAATPEPPALPGFAADDGSLLDVMVVYTPEAAAASADIAADAQFAVSLTNQSYQNSGINTRMRLVYTAPVTTGDSGNSTTDLTRLQNPSDGFMDEVQGLRNAHCADVVVLLTESGSACGVAFVMASVQPSFEAYAYAVVRRTCATGGQVFGHEVGHVLGGRHDWFVDNTDFGPYTYNHGFVCPCNAWHDIMAYGNACGGCTTIPYFSNPDISYLGNPLGVPEGQFQAADMRKTINNTALTASNFRYSSVCHTLNLSLTSTAVGDTPDGNNNAIPDPGEIVNLSLTLLNNEAFAATNVSATLSSSTPGVNLLDNTASWANIPAAGSGTSLAPHFQFAVASSVPCGTVLQFSLALTAEEGTWVKTFQFTTGCSAWCQNVAFAGASGAADISVCADTGVQISWPAATLWGAAPLGYEVRRYSNSGCTGNETVMGTGLMSTSFVDNTSANGNGFWYKVYASNDCGRSSNGGTCTGPAQDDVTTLAANAFISPNPVVQGTPQSFTSSVSGGTTPYSYLWDFTNDGTTDATTQNSTYTYASGALYTWRYRVTDTQGCFVQRTGQATVNTPPWPTCAIDISNRTASDEIPRVDSRNAVWQSPAGGSAYNIFYWNGSTVQQLTSDGMQNRNAHISNGKVAWERFDLATSQTSGEIFYWDGTTTTQLTNNAVLDQNPIMDNGQVVWENINSIGYYNGTTIQYIDPHPFAHANTSFNGGQIAWTRVANSFRQVWFWNGSSVQQITNTPGDKGGIRLWNGKMIWHGQNPVTGTGPYQIFYWNGTTITQLTNTAGNNFTGGFSGGVAFWRGHDGNDWEIFRWDGSTITQLTNNTTDDGLYGNSYLESDGDQAVWTYWDGNDTEIYFWNGTSVQALTNDITSEVYPSIRGGQVVWEQPVSGNSYDIMFWQADPTEIRNLKFTGPNNIAWDPAICAAPPNYKVIRGDRANLSASGGNVDLGAVTCVVPGTANNFATVSGAPASGAWFYLVKEAAGPNYGKSSAGEPEQPASGACP